MTSLRLITSKNLFWELTGKRKYLGKSAKMYSYDPRFCHLFSFGRNAIFAACRILNITENDEVLAPAWICDEALQPFRMIGCKISFYLTNPNTFEVDLLSIKNKINKKTKLIHIVNHFGHSQKWDELQKDLKYYQIPILEDNAFSLFSSYKGKTLGTFGDLAIFSLRKSFPVIDGGMLRINNNKYKLSSLIKESRWYYPSERYQALSLIEVFVRKNIGFGHTLIDSIKKKHKPIPGVKSKPPLFSDKKKGVPNWPRGGISSEFSCNYLRPISRLSRLILRVQSEDIIKNIINKKRSSYNIIVNALKDLKGINIINSVLKEGEVPYSVSILIKKNRDYVLQNLEKKYPVMAWPTLPYEVIEKIDDFPDVKKLGTQLLQFNLQGSLIDIAENDELLKQLVYDLKKSLEI